MCTDKNNDKNETNLPCPLFHSSNSFLNWCKIHKPMTLKLLDFYFLFINPSQPGVAFLYPLKTSENLKVF